MDAKCLINLDVNASYGLSSELSERLSSLLKLQLHNPSSTHRAGQLSKALILESREQILKGINAPKGTQLVFTSGATEANNSLFEGIFRAKELSQYKVISSPLEHPCIIEKLAELKSRGLSISHITPARNGYIDPEELLGLIDPQTKIISLMLANNESGAVSNISELVSAVKARAPHVLFHSDAAQALGKMELNFGELSLDFMTLSGHKVGALTGVGALVIKQGVFIDPLSFGGPQEKHLRAGTENVIGIASFGEAVQFACSDILGRIEKMRAFKHQLWLLLSSAISDLRLNSDLDGGLANTLNIQIPNLNAADLLVALDIRGILISSGAACASGKPDPSHVLIALGLSPEEARSSIRISLADDYDQEIIPYCAAQIIDAIKNIRGY